MYQWEIKYNLMRIRAKNVIFFSVTFKIENKNTLFSLTKLKSHCSVHSVWRTSSPSSVSFDIIYYLI